MLEAKVNLDTAVAAMVDTYGGEVIKAAVVRLDSSALLPLLISTGAEA